MKKIPDWGYYGNASSTITQNIVKYWDPLELMGGGPMISEDSTSSKLSLRMPATTPVAGNIDLELSSPYMF